MMKFRQTALMVSLGLLMSMNTYSYAADGLTGLTDDEMAAETGQALFNLSYTAPGDVKNAMPSSTQVGFYRLGFEAEVAINANIKNLQLGCGGVNGAGACDVEIQNFSLGCVANSAGSCVSLPTNTLGSVSGAATHTTSSTTVSDIAANQNQLKDFVLNNPFFDIAIKNPNSASLREVVGFRIGAEKATGPMSFNDIVNYSGYLSGKANITMQAKNDLALTRPSNWVLPTAGQAQSSDGTKGTLGLENFDIAGGIAQADNLRVDITNNVNRTWAVAASGSRFKQVSILNTNFLDVVTEVTQSVDNIEPKTGILPGWALDLVYPAVRNSIRDKIADQLAQGLGLADRNALPGYNIPYNLANVGSLDINSPAFGISLQSMDIAYPGYYQYDANGVATTTPAYMSKGWGMYLPNAFTLNISQPLDTFTANILGGDAKIGNIVGLPAPYRNCYGGLTFC